VRGVVVMPVNTPPRPSPSTMVSVHIARYLEDRFEFPIMHTKNPDDFADGTFDLALWVCGSHSFCREEYRDQMADVYRRTRVNIYVQNDYYIPPLPKAVRMSKATGNPFRRWTTIPRLVRAAEDAFVNWNLIAYAPIAPVEPTETGLVYWGAYRQGRDATLRRYFAGRLPYRATFSTATGKGRWGMNEKLRAAVSGAKLTPKFTDLIRDIARWDATIYLEDEYSHKVDTSPGTRFYEALSAGIAIFVDAAAAPTLRRAGYDVDPFVVRSKADLARRLMPDSVGEARRTQATWRRGYRRTLTAQVRRAYALVERDLHRSASHGYSSTTRPQPKGDSNMSARKIQGLVELVEFVPILNHVKPSSNVLDFATKGAAAEFLRAFPRRTPSRYVVPPGGIPVDATWYHTNGMKAKDEYSVILTKAKPKEANAMSALLVNRLAKHGVALVRVTAAGSDKIQRVLEKRGFEIVDSYGIAGDLKEMGDAAERRLGRELAKRYPADVVSALVALIYPEDATELWWVVRHVDATTDEAPSVKASPARKRREKPSKTKAKPATKPERSTKRKPLKMKGAKTEARTSGAFIRQHLVDAGYTGKSKRPPNDWCDRLAAAVVERFSTAAKTRTTKRSDILYVWRKLCP
jgi:hypothetical protein